MAASRYSNPCTRAVLILMLSSLATSSSLVCERDGSSEFELWTLESSTIELQTSVPSEGLGEYCDVIVSGSIDENAPAALDGDLDGSYRPVGCHNSQPAYLRNSAPDNEDDAGEDILLWRSDIMWVFTRVGEVADVPGFVGIMGGDAFWLSDNNTTAAAPVKVTLGGNGTVVGGQLQINTMCKGSQINGTDRNLSLTSLHGKYGTLQTLHSMVRSNPVRGLGKDISTDKAFVGGVVFACIAVAGVVFIAARSAIINHSARDPGSGITMRKPLIDGRDSSAV